MFCVNEATKKLFKAIEFQSVSGEGIALEKAWNHFQQALKEGANVNAFEEGMTPLMYISSIFVISNNEEYQSLELMAKLLVKDKNIDINIKSKQDAIEAIPKKDGGYPVYIFQGREVVDMGENGCIYRDDRQSVGEGFIPSETYTRAEDEIKTGKMKENTALHIACQFGNVDMVRILLTHPDIKTNIKNYENKSPKDCIPEHAKKKIESEFLKVEKRNQLSEAVAQKRKQTNCAYAFLLSGALAAGLCFTVDNPVPLVAATLLFFAIGCRCLYRANTVLNDVNCSQVGCENTKFSN